MSKSVELHEIKALVDWMNLSEDVKEFSLKYGDLELFISRKEDSAAPATNGAVAPVAAAAPAPAPAAPVAAAPAAAPVVADTTPSGPLVASKYEAAEDEVLIKAPMVGTFYASPKPGAPAFVKAGDTVAPETVLCIVEVMKLMNNLEAGVHGTIEKVFVENEQAVEYGQPLMLIKLSK